MTASSDLFKRLREARGKATPGEWKEQYCVEHLRGNVPDMILSKEGKEEVAVVCSFQNHSEWDKPSAEFISLIANEILKIIEIAEVATKALEKIRSIIIEHDCEECGTTTVVEYDLTPSNRALDQIEAIAKDEK